MITLAVITASSRMTRKRGNFKFQVHPHNRQTTAECDSELSRRKFKMAFGTVTYTSRFVDWHSASLTWFDLLERTWAPETNSFLGVL